VAIQGRRFARGLKLIHHRIHIRPSRWLCYRSLQPKNLLFRAKSRSIRSLTCAPSIPRPQSVTVRERILSLGKQLQAPFYSVVMTHGPETLFPAALRDAQPNRVREAVKRGALWDENEQRWQCIICWHREGKRVTYAPHTGTRKSAYNWGSMFDHWRNVHRKEVRRSLSNTSGRGGSATPTEAWTREQALPRQRLAPAARLPTRPDGLSPYIKLKMAVKKSELQDFSADEAWVCALNHTSEKANAVSSTAPVIAHPVQPLHHMHPILYTDGMKAYFQGLQALQGFQGMSLQQIQALFGNAITGQPTFSIGTPVGIQQAYPVGTATLGTPVHCSRHPAKASDS
jgi:hypothetical protein